MGEETGSKWLICSRTHGYEEAGPEFINGSVGFEGPYSQSLHYPIFSPHFLLIAKSSGHRRF